MPPTEKLGLDESIEISVLTCQVWDMRDRAPSSARDDSAAGRRASAVNAWEDLLPDVAERLELLVAEVLDEVPAHAVEVRAAGGVQPPAGRRGEDGDRPAGVALAGLALDEAVAGEAIDEAGQAAAREQDRGGEIVHPHLPVAGVGEVHEHLVRGQAQAVRRVELAVERLDHP